MAKLFPREGGCRCGAVRFRVTAAPMLTMACHCRGCQRMTGGPYSLSAAIPTPAFEVTQGEPVPGGMKSEARHHFCPSCMSWMFTTAAGMPFVNVRSTMLDDPEGFEPFVSASTPFGGVRSNPQQSRRSPRFPGLSSVVVRGGSPEASARS